MVFVPELVTTSKGFYALSFPHQRKICTKEAIELIATTLSLVQTISKFILILALPFS